MTHYRQQLAIVISMMLGVTMGSISQTHHRLSQQEFSLLDSYPSLYFVYVPQVIVAHMVALDKVVPFASSSPALQNVGICITYNSSVMLYDTVVAAVPEMLQLYKKYRAQLNLTDMHFAAIMQDLALYHHAVKSGDAYIALNTHDVTRTDASITVICNLLSGHKAMRKYDALCNPDQNNSTTN